MEKFANALFPLDEDISADDGCAFPTEDIGDMDSDTDGAAAIASNADETTGVGGTGDLVECKFVTEDPGLDGMSELDVLGVTVGRVNPDTIKADKAEATTIIDLIDNLMESDGTNVEEELELDKEPEWWHQVWEIGPREEDNWSDSNKEEIELETGSGQQNNALREGHIVPFTVETNVGARFKGDCQSRGIQDSGLVNKYPGSSELDADAKDP